MRDEIDGAPQLSRRGEGAEAEGRRAVLLLARSTTVRGGYPADSSAERHVLSLSPLRTITDSERIEMPFSSAEELIEGGFPCI